MEGLMKLELGQLIIDNTGSCRNMGVVIDVWEDSHGYDVYRIYWVCPRDRGNRTVTLTYEECELEMEHSHCFEVIA